MRVLVMGGTEFISLHLVRALVRDGHALTVFNRRRRTDRLPAGVRVITGDRKDHAGLAAALSGAAFDAVCDITYAPTTGPDVAALAGAVASARPQFIFMSTGRVYDHALQIPYHEDTPRGEYWGEEVVTQVGFVELIGEILECLVTLVHFHPALLKELAPAGLVFGQNLVYDCHAVYTTQKLRTELGLSPRYTLVSGLRQTFEWYLKEGLDRRRIDFTFEDQLLARIRP